MWGAGIPPNWHLLGALPPPAFPPHDAMPRSAIPCPPPLRLGVRPFPLGGLYTQTAPCHNMASLCLPPMGRNDVHGYLPPCPNTALSKPRRFLPLFLKVTFCGKHFLSCISMRKRLGNCDILGTLAALFDSVDFFCVVMPSS